MEEKDKKVATDSKRDEQGRFVKTVAPKKEAAKSEPKTKEPAKKAETTTKAAPKKETAKKEEVKKEVKTSKTPAKKQEEKVVKEASVKEVKATPKKEDKKAAPKKEVKKASNGHKEAKVINRVEKRYKEEIVPELIKQFNYTSVMQVPKLHKIVLNMGVGDALQNAKNLDDAVKELALIAGQQPVVTKAKKSIANYKLRAGQKIGCKVTLRGLKMYDFFDKLITIALPRVRDFRGVSKNSFDGKGNYSLGVKEQLIFPEIDFDSIGKIRGMDIVIVTTAHTDEEAFALLKALGMPFKR